MPCACTPKKRLGATGSRVEELVRARAKDRAYQAKLSNLQLRKNLCFDASSLRDASGSLGKRVAREALDENRDEAKRRGWKAKTIRRAERCKGL